MLCSFCHCILCCLTVINLLIHENNTSASMHLLYLYYLQQIDIIIPIHYSLYIASTLISGQPPQYTYNTSTALCIPQIYLYTILYTHTFIFIYILQYTTRA